MTNKKEPRRVNGFFGEEIDAPNKETLAAFEKLKQIFEEKDYKDYILSKDKKIL